MSNEPFMEAVVDTILFFELSDAEAVDEDAAVAMLEQIAVTLQRLAPAEKTQFLEYVQSLGRRAGSDKERLALKSLASNMGLLPE